MHKIIFPLTDPILVFMLVLFIVLLIPLLLRKTGIPTIIGLIISGIFIGPFAFNLVNQNDIIELFSKVGLLYIMFLAGLELDFSEFKKNKYQASTFGLFNFFFPFIAGYALGVYFFYFDILSSTLLGIMLASNTLIAFPSISKLGLQKAPSVTTAISGTVIADTIVLIVLAFLTSILSADSGQLNILYFLGYFSLFTLFVFLVLPKLSSWFIRRLANDGDLQFLFTLAVLFAVSFASEMVGAEPIIGAFFAGLAMNKLVPSSSTLMNRIDFVGNTLFIPFFLISVGMLVNLEILFQGYLPLVYAVILTFVAVAGKWFAAILTQLLFKQSKHETQVLFGLTTARAAATLAIAMIGLKNGLIDQDLFNAIIVLILLTSLFSSYLTERYGKKLLIEEDLKIRTADLINTNRILIPIGNPENAKNLMDLALLLHNPKDKEPLFPLAVIPDDKDARDRLAQNKSAMEKVVKQAGATGVLIQAVTRVDLNVPSAISRAVKELEISDVLIGWSGRASKEISKIFGNMLETILDSTCSNIIVSHLVKPINITQKMHIVLPENAEKEPGFAHWLSLIMSLCRQLSCNILVYSSENTLNETKAILSKRMKGISIQYKTILGWPQFEDGSIGNDTNLYVIINSRNHTISFDPKFYKLTYKLPKIFENNNVLNIYPPHKV
ncbi:MAG: cation:proton antiporter [Bacteroidales bacterium]|nr:cation:proton antiporter [Bacteroidales bacterium]